MNVSLAFYIQLSKGYENCNESKKTLQKRAENV